VVHCKGSRPLHCSLFSIPILHAAGCISQQPAAAKTYVPQRPCHCKSNKLNYHYFSPARLFRRRSPTHCARLHTLRSAARGLVPAIAAAHVRGRVVRGRRVAACGRGRAHGVRRLKGGREAGDTQRGEGLVARMVLLRDQRGRATGLAPHTGPHPEWACCRASTHLRARCPAAPPLSSSAL